MEKIGEQTAEIRNSDEKMTKTGTEYFAVEPSAHGNSLDQFQIGPEKERVGVINDMNIYIKNIYFLFLCNLG